MYYIFGVYATAVLYYDIAMETYYSNVPYFDQRPRAAPEPPYCFDTPPDFTPADLHKTGQWNAFLHRTGHPLFLFRKKVLRNLLPKTNAGNRFRRR